MNSLSRLLAAQLGIVLLIAFAGIQSSTGQCYILPSPASGEVRIFAQSVCGDVDNDPQNPTVFTIDAPSTITKIGTYHWNHGAGATPGIIELKGQDGTVYGPWQASGQPGQGGVQDAYWIATMPNGIDLPAGTYEVLDSDRSTWAYSSESGNSGIVSVIGLSKSDSGHKVGNNETPSDLDTSVVDKFKTNGIVVSNDKINPEILGVGVDDDLRLVQVSFTPLFKELNGGNTVYAMLVVKNLGERPLEQGVITVTFMSRGGTYSFKGGEAKCPTIQPRETIEIPLIIPTAPAMSQSSLFCTKYWLEGGINEWMGAYYKIRGEVMTDELIEFKGCCQVPGAPYERRDCGRSYDPVEKKWYDE